MKVVLLAIAAVCLSFTSCGIFEKKTGIVIWEFNENLNYEKIINANYKELLKQYPKSLFIDFRNVNKYSKSSHILYMKDNQWHKDYNTNFNYLWHLNDTCFFSVIIDGNNLLTGVNYLCRLSAEMPKLPYKNAIFLIQTEDSNLKFSDSIFDNEEKLGSNKKSDLNYNFIKFEQYFELRNKITE